MQLFSILLLTANLVISGGVQSKATSSFVGTWRLVSIKARSEKGEISYPFSPKAIGQIMYTIDGRMSVFVIQPERPPFASGDMRAGTDSEVRAAAEGFLGYFGTYSVDTAKAIVTHHIQGAFLPNWEGRDQIRYYKMEGNRLTLSSPMLVFAGQRCELIVDWERVK